MSSIKSTEENQGYSKADLVEIIENGIPFNHYLGVKVESFSKGDIILRLEPKNSSLVIRVVLRYMEV